MQYFPLFVDTQSLKVVIVGAGDVASRKLDLLCRTEAVITVVAPEVSDEVLAYAKQGRIALEQRPVEAEDIEGISLLYMATADEQLNQHYAEVASSKGVWVNVVDSPELCRFITPSIVDRGRLIVAISTAGAAPVFARDLRAKLESLLSPSIAPLFDFIASKRAEVQSRLPVFKQRKLFWERFSPSMVSSSIHKLAHYMSNASVNWMLLENCCCLMSKPMHNCCPSLFYRYYRKLMRYTVLKHSSHHYWNYCAEMRSDVSIKA